MSPEEALPLLQAALSANDARPLWTLSDVRADLAAGGSKLWLGERSAMVTSESDYANGERLIEAWLAAGDLREITGAIPRLEAYARERGMTQAHVTGRHGWLRTLQPFGYGYHATTVRKLLT